MELKFDKMDIDTTLAQRYSEENDFVSLFKDDKYVYCDSKDLPTIHYYELEKKYTEISCNLENLAVLMKKNVNLFAQLEYLNREIPIEDTKAQLNLIIQNLYFLSSCNVDNIPETDPIGDERESNYSHFVMCRETPILNLGFVVRACVYLYPSRSIPSITASKETRELCYLFISLCRDAGLTVVAQLGGTAMEYHHGKEVLGTVGVISESADVDSAVDVFLTSSKQVPWKLRKILVQESVYKQFKDALTWKCNLNITREAKTTQSTSDLSLHFNGREYILDDLDITDPEPSEVTVEAYRTRKELLSFLNQYRPHYVSLWANDIAEINEVAHSIPSQVVWVNNFAEFRGPARISDAIYSAKPLYKSNYRYLPKTEVCEVLELQKSWLKLDSQARYEVLSKTLDGIVKSSISDVYGVFRKAQLYSHGTFVEVGKDYVCQGVTVLSDKIHYCIQRTDIFNESFFKSVFRGNAFMFKTPILNPDITFLINSLKNAGLPVSEVPELFTETDKYDCHTCEVMFDFDQTTRVIWTNSGTIFAN